jgi:hypothetical protein
MARQRVRRGWRREGDGLDARYYHIESDWVIVHGGHPTANFPYYGESPRHKKLLLGGGLGLGMAFKHLKVAQESVELFHHNEQQERTTTMGWQEEIKGKTLADAVTEIAALVKGEMVDNETYENVDQLNAGQYPDVIKLHRIWVCNKQEDGGLYSFCADLHEYDDKKEPFFANRIMSLEEGPWGWQPPAKFGKRKGGDKARKPSKKHSIGSPSSKQFQRELGIATRNTPKKKPAKKKAPNKDRATPHGKRLDDKTHKLVAGRKAACGLPMGVMEAGIFSGGVEGRDTWHWVDCKKCLAVKPEIIHSVQFEDSRWYCMYPEDEKDGKRWKAKTECGELKSPLETTTDHGGGGVNCMDCLSVVAPSCRRHFVADGGNQKSTLCGAKTTSANEYSTDSWWLCTCPDCYRIKDAPSVHPMQEDDVQLLLHNSMVAARNQGMKPTQERCVSCSADSARAKTSCLACAVLNKRGINTDDDWENKLAKLFNLPYEWVMDLLKGWDGDKAPELTYPTAFKLGKKLWRKHG